MEIKESGKTSQDRGSDLPRPTQLVNARALRIENQSDSLFIDVLLAYNLNDRLKRKLKRALNFDPWGQCTFKAAMASRQGLEAQLLKVPGLGLKGVAELLQFADTIAGDYGAQRAYFSPQLPLEIHAPSLEEVTPFFDALRYQHASVRLRNVLAAAESTLPGHPTLADFIENRGGLRSFILRLPNIGKKTQQELIELVDQSIKSLRGGLVVDTDSPSDLTSHSPEMAAPEAASVPEPRSIEEVLDHLLLKIRPRDADIIRRRKGMGGNPKMTLEDLGKEHGLTRERIRQVEKKAVRRLAHLAITGNLKAVIRQYSAALWDLINDGSGVLLIDDLDNAVTRLGSESRFAIELGWGSIDDWLSETLHATAVGWMDSVKREPLLTALTQRLLSVAKGHPLPFPAASLDLMTTEQKILAPACQLAGLFYSRGYICSGRLRGRKLRAVRMHAMLSTRAGESSSVGSIVEQYRRRYADDPCSLRDALIVMNDAPHLFLDIMDDQWSSLMVHSAMPVDADAIARASNEGFVEEPESGTSLDQTIAALIERTLERDGPLRFSDLRARVMGEFQHGQSSSSIGPVVITSGRFGRVAPGLYGLPQQLRDVAQGNLFPDSLLAIDQCRWFVAGLYAGCHHGDFPAWTPLLEMRLCQWAESARIDSALFDSLLAVVEPERWPGSQGDREYWARIKSKRGHYWLEQPAPPLLDSPPPLDRLLAAAIDAMRRGGSNWITVNRVWSKRIDHDGAASLLALMVATRVLLPSAHWQRHHRLGPDAVKIINLLTPHLMHRGTLHWEDPVGRQIGAICRAECELGWVGKAELMQLVDSLAIADEPEPVTDISPPIDALEQQLKQLRLRRQAALIESLMQEEGTQGGAR